MGLSSSSQKTSSTSTNAPSSFNMPYINAGTAALGSAYNQTQPIATQASTALGSALTSLAPNISSGASTLGAANNYDQFVLGGGFLNGNPYTQGQIDATDNSVRNQVQSQFSQAGRTGSGANTFAIGSALANSENALRYADYNNERQAMAQAASAAPSLGSSALGQYLQAAGGAVALPQTAASGYAGGLGSLVGNYNTQTGTGKSTSTMSGIEAIAKLAQSASLFLPGGGG